VGKKRSTRRDRREPVRRPVRSQPGQVAARTGPKPPARNLLPAVTDGGMYPLVFSVPIEAVPLYAALALMHQAGGGQSAATCVTTCTILADSLAYLGFDTEPMAACATVVHHDDTRAKFADVGVWEHPPVVRADGMTNGHMVLWAGAFGRLVDPTIAQEPAVLAAAQTDPSQTFACVIPVPSREQMLSGPAIATVREPFLISWMLFPEWTEILNQTLQIPLTREAVDYGALNLAHRTVQLLGKVGEVRNLRGLHGLNPQLADLLAGRSQLPPLPEISSEAAALLGL
jgi:hypothetical protein